MNEIPDFAWSEKVFREYVSSYDVQDGQVRLKIVHTFHVVQCARRIALSLHLSEEEVYLAQVIALFHDIGRFEQIRRYHDFRDNKTIDHAELGVEELKKGILERAVPVRKYDTCILTSIAQHNKYAISETVKEEMVLRQCKIIRDADKLDIFRVRSEDALKDLAYFTEKDLETSVISKDVLDTFYQKKTIQRNQVKTAVDSWVAGVALVFDFNYVVSLKILEESRYVSGMIDRFHYAEEEKMQAVEQFALHYLHIAK